MYARKDILPNDSYVHLFFRCHNKQFFFKPNEIKGYILNLWAKYKKKYGIKIYDFIIMDNHAHLVAKATSTADLGHFMRVVNSLIARYINKHFERDSQAIRERYKSPLITTLRYFRQTMQYIWLNRFKLNGLHPTLDLYCSASWRFNRSNVGKIAKSEEERNLFLSLLDNHEEIFDDNLDNQRKTVVDMINEAISKLKEVLTDTLFLHGHTIGDKISVTFRRELLLALLKPKTPYTPESSE